MFYFHYLRVARKLTQKKLQRLTGINQAHISLMELGRLTPTSEQLGALADAFDVPPGLLLKHVAVTPPAEAREQAEPLA